MVTGITGDTISSEELVFDQANDGGKCAKFFVHCHSGSAAPALVRIPGLHESAEAAGVVAGETVEFQLGDNGIAEVYIEGSGGTATVSYGVVARYVNA